jgi:DNA mismatch endonuclease, patch repair protein
LADKLDKAKRSANMAAIKSKGTKPEMKVRRLLHAMGYRFRLHRADLPGRPDIVLPSRRAIIEVRGCFWHQHPDPNCAHARRPKSNTGYWDPKLERNQARDKANLKALEGLGWRVLVLWDCELGDTCLAQRLGHFLGPPGPPEA